MTRIEVWLNKEIAKGRFKFMKRGLAYLAEKLGVSESHMFHLMKGDKTLSENHGEALCKATGESVSYFYPNSRIIAKVDTFVYDPKVEADFMKRRW